MFARFADWLIARAKRTPYFHLRGYMNRWWLVPFIDAGSGGKGQGDIGTGAVSFRQRPFAWCLQRLGIAARIHEIVRSDLPRRPGTFVPDMHDHPWSYITIILRGGYFECTPGDRRWYGPGSVLFRDYKSRHYLRLQHEWRPVGLGPEIPAVTLFITFRYRQKWGFWMPDGTKMPHDVYHEKFPRAKEMFQ